MFQVKFLSYILNYFLWEENLLQQNFLSFILQNQGYFRKNFLKDMNKKKGIDSKNHNKNVPMNAIFLYNLQH